MTKNKNITLFALLVFGFFLLALPETGISSVPQGCCISNTTDSCLGCPLGGCATQEDFCIENGGAVAGEGICFDSPVGAVCGISDAENGCCVIEPGDCVENVDSRGCFDTEHGIFWHPGETCEQVQECIAQRDVPTLSEWGLIAMAGILGIVGFMVIRRRKATA